VASDWWFGNRKATILERLKVEIISINSIKGKSKNKGEGRFAPLFQDTVIPSSRRPSLVEERNRDRVFERGYTEFMCDKVTAGCC
jgi:hypothetical protein